MLNSGASSTELGRNHLLTRLEGLQMSQEAQQRALEVGQNGSDSQPNSPLSDHPASFGERNSPAIYVSSISPPTNHFLDHVTATIQSKEELGTPEDELSRVPSYTSAVKENTFSMAPLSNDLPDYQEALCSESTFESVQRPRPAMVHGSEDVILRILRGRHV